MPDDTISKILTLPWPKRRDRLFLQHQDGSEADVRFRSNWFLHAHGFKYAADVLVQNALVQNQAVFCFIVARFSHP